MRPAVPTLLPCFRDRVDVVELIVVVVVPEGLLRSPARMVGPDHARASRSRREADNRIIDQAGGTAPGRRWPLHLQRRGPAHHELARSGSQGTQRRRARWRRSNHRPGNHRNMLFIVQFLLQGVWQQLQVKEPLSSVQRGQVISQDHPEHLPGNPPCWKQAAALAVQGIAVFSKSSGTRQWHR